MSISNMNDEGQGWPDIQGLPMPYISFGYITDVEKCAGVIEHCQITDPHLRLPTRAHTPADPSSTYNCNIYMHFIYDQGHCNISYYMIY